MQVGRKWPKPSAVSKDLGSSGECGSGMSPADLPETRKLALDPRRNRWTSQPPASREPAGYSLHFLDWSSIVPRLVLDWCLESQVESSVEACYSHGGEEMLHPRIPAAWDGPVLGPGRHHDPRRGYPVRGSVGEGEPGRGNIARVAGGGSGQGKAVLQRPGEAISWRICDRSCVSQRHRKGYSPGARRVRRDAALRRLAQSATGLSRRGRPVPSRRAAAKTRAGPAAEAGSQPGAEGRAGVVG